jgi:hypothetical protein
VISTTQLLVFRFPRDANFEGELLGAIERIETGMSVRVLDVLFIGRDADTGELQAFSGAAESAGRTGAALEFRLDPTARRRSSERALEASPGLERLGGVLEPGTAVAAVLLDHRWAKALADAVERTGGEPALLDFVDAERLADMVPQLVASVSRPAT